MQAHSYEQFQRKKEKLIEVKLICLWQDSLQRSPEPNSDSIHSDFTMIRFISDSIQHRPDSIQTQFTSASPVLDSTRNSQKMRNQILIDSESEPILTSLILICINIIVISINLSSQSVKSGLCVALVWHQLSTTAHMVDGRWLTLLLHTHTR